jgi:hypothetical protein
MRTQWKCLLPALTLFACGASGGSEADPTAETGNELLTDTVVTIQADGTFKQVVTEVTREQRAKQIEARSKQLAAEPVATRAKRMSGEVASETSAVLRTDASCDYRDLWLYDAGQNNLLCIAHVSLGFNQSDSLDLSKVRYGRVCYTFPCTSYPSWSGRVASIWTGFNDGGLYTATPWSLTPFAAWEPWQRAIDPASSTIVYFVGPHLN